MQLRHCEPGDAALDSSPGQERAADRLRTREGKDHIGVSAFAHREGCTWSSWGRWHQGERLRCPPVPDTEEEVGGPGLGGAHSRHPSEGTV